MQDGLQVVLQVGFLLAFAVFKTCAHVLLHDTYLYSVSTVFPWVEVFPHLISCVFLLSLVSVV